MIDIKNTNAAAVAAQAASQGAKTADTTAFESLMSALATEARTPDEGVARRGENHPGSARDSRPAPAKPSRVGAAEPGASVRPSLTRHDNPGQPGNVRVDKPERPERPERPGRPEKVAAKDSTTPKDRADKAKPADEPAKDTTKQVDTEQTSETAPAANTAVAQQTGTDVAAEIVETLTETSETTPEVVPEESAVPLTPEETTAQTPAPAIETETAAPETGEPTLAQPEAAPDTSEPHATLVETPQAEKPIDGADIAAQLKSGKAPSLIPAKPEVAAPVVPEEIEQPAIMSEALAAAGQAAGNTANTTAAGASNAGSSAVSAVSGTSAQTTPVASAAPAAAPAVSTPNPVAQAAPTYAPNLSQQLFDQMQHQLSRLKVLGQGQHQLKLAINPETFGPVRVAANFHADGTVHLQLLGASEAARDQLRQVLSDLRRDLASTGLQADLDVAENAQEFAQFTGAGTGSSERETGQAGQAGAASTDGSETEPEDVVSRPKVGDVLKDGTDGSVDMFA
ncbi:flagellar hook-length control protein FliK [Mobiluncus sp.]|uniref:flagellar hook-length control protein FliK n=1 Tax=Mobiluncus sp. TaxID=47293 RepID=UPI002A90B48C|nr:flagellar hook-length control protein FliK [Mobiluncus sp.]MDY6077273.1 flagellar hook-length control protein FliK [Mobiluncus sp.]